MTHRSYVLISEKEGVFLGAVLGLGFWSRLDPVGQLFAPTWSSEEDARSFETALDDVSPLAVEAADPYYATVAEVVAAGGPSWDPDSLGVTEKAERKRK